FGRIRRIWVHEAETRTAATMASPCSVRNRGGYSDDSHIHLLRQLPQLARTIPEPAVVLDLVPRGSIARTPSRRRLCVEPAITTDVLSLACSTYPGRAVGARDPRFVACLICRADRIEKQGADRCNGLPGTLPLRSKHVHRRPDGGHKTEHHRARLAGAEGAH